MTEEMDVPSRAAERLIYRELRFWIKNLLVSTELLADLHSNHLLNDGELEALKEKLVEAQQSGNTIPLNETLCLVVLQMNNPKVDQFLVTLEKYQPDVVRYIFGGKSTADVMTGYREGQAPCQFPTASEVMPLTPQGKPEEVLIEPFPRVSVVEADDGEDPLPPLSEYLLMHGVGAQEPSCCDTVIDSRGGTVSSDPPHVCLTIPAGALSTKAAIPLPGFKTFDVTTFSAEDGQEISCGMVVYLYPHGLKFQGPVTVTVHDECLVPGRQVVIFASDTDEEDLPRWENITDTANVLVDSSEKTVSFMMNHFSIAAIFYVSVLSTAALSAIVHVLQSKDLYVVLFWRHAGNNEIRLLICASFDRSSLLSQPNGVAEDFKRATDPSDPVQLAYGSSYNYVLHVDGARLRKDFARKLNEGLDRQSQKTVRLLSCRRNVHVYLECVGTHGQVLLGALLQLADDDPAMFEPHLPSSTVSSTNQTGPGPSLSPWQPETSLLKRTTCNLLLRKNYLRLIQNMDPIEVRDHLVRKLVLETTSEEYQEIDARTTRRDKNRRILYCIWLKGDAAFCTFVQILEEIHPTLGQLLSDHD